MKKIILALILSTCFAVAVSAQTVAFTNVNVIPMDKERVLKDQTVLVKDGMIVEIGKKSKNPERRASHQRFGQISDSGFDGYAHASACRTATIIPIRLPKTN